MDPLELSYLTGMLFEVALLIITPAAYRRAATGPDGF